MTENATEILLFRIEKLRLHSTKYVKRRGGGFLREFRDALREQWGSIVTEGQCEIHRKDAEAPVTLTFVDEVGT